jgi:glycerol-3-phosphate dehydrogenase subunit B
VSDAVDVVVVGAGVAGCAAALAARQAGARVRVLEAGAGATALAGGAWDVAPMPLGAAGATFTLSDAVRSVAQARPGHPYARLADPVQAVQEAHRAVLPRLGGYRPFDLDGRGVLLATDLGLWRRAATAQTEVLDLTRLATAPLAVAEPGGYPGWDATFLAASLAETGAGAVHVAEASVLSAEVDAVRHPHELAAHGDREEFQAQLGAALRASAGDARAVLLPPMLGLVTDGVAEAVQRVAGRPVGEVVGALAGPQGLRLARRIHAALTAAGVEMHPSPVEHIEPRGAVLRVALEDDGTVEAPAVVLATGKHVGGGLLVEGGVVREPLANLPVQPPQRVGRMPSSSAGPDPTEQFGTNWWHGGDGFSLGVAYDERLRGLDGTGQPLHPGLFVAGALLTGVDPARDGTGLGCCCTTGHLAGTHAAAHALGEGSARTSR